MIPAISPSFKEATTECALDRKHSSAWTLHAASTVIKMNIQSVYLVVNGPGDERLSLSHAVDKTEISTGIVLEGDGERGGKYTKLSILMGLVLSFCSVTECALDRKHSSAWTLHAASTVIKMNIQSVYLVVNGPTDQYIIILNKIFVPFLLFTSIYIYNALKKM
jgi:hypothetical protein